MRTAVWKAALAGVVLFILGVAAGAATIDMLEGEDVAPTVADAGHGHERGDEDRADGYRDRHRGGAE